MKLILVLLIAAAMVLAMIVNTRWQREKSQRPYSLFSLKHISADLRSKNAYIFLAFVVLILLLGFLIVEPWNRP